MKRTIDLVLAVLLIAMLSPVLIAISAISFFLIGPPILFGQLRPGYAGRPFRLYKFRTMLDSRGSDGRQRPDGERLTAYGRFLRASSIDELPELWNILCGNMSFVGPRPLLMEYLPRYSRQQARRHEVLPGLTGWAQVNGRNAISWEDKFALDVWYVDHNSRWLDLKIIVMTVKKVFAREGISAANHQTMPEFMGSHGDE